MSNLESEWLDYELPDDLIARRPCEPRDSSRLMVLRPNAGTIGHFHFRDLPALLCSGDLIVVNDSRVLPARLFGRRTATGGRWEGLYLSARPDGCWEMLCQTRGRLNVGETVAVEPGPLTLTLVERPSGRPWVFRPDTTEPPDVVLPRHGHVPLPPYIRSGRGDDLDRAAYQTVYAGPAGSVAAPTAGLHFTTELLQRLSAVGVEIARVTLHVGPGTFLPLRDGQTELHRERCEFPAETADAIARCRQRGGRVIAVGTTAVRTLETAARHGGGPWSGETDLFIRPPYAFHYVDGLITNFHLPRTSLLLLVAAVAGSELLKRAYEIAVAERYRFYSYGDAMFISPRSKSSPG